ncbi:unnamed protein product [marine sediment metagenome]|uniref:Uncharacterized protein n=1 Tax=marine sediment metagenome TaxID=412755 RepID=X1NV49_9ZZZZ
MKKKFCLFIAFVFIISTSCQGQAQTNNVEKKIRQSDISDVKEEVAKTNYEEVRIKKILQGQFSKYVLDICHSLSKRNIVGSFCAEFVPVF